MRLTPTPSWIASFTTPTASHSRATRCDARTHRLLDQNTNSVKANHVDDGSEPCAASDRNPARDQIGTMRVIMSVSLRGIVGIRIVAGRDIASRNQPFPHVVAQRQKRAPFRSEEHKPDIQYIM